MKPIRKVGVELFGISYIEKVSKRMRDFIWLCEYLLCVELKRRIWDETINVFNIIKRNFFKRYLKGKKPIK